MTFSFTIEIPSSVEYSLPFLIVALVIVVSIFIMQNHRIAAHSAKLLEKSKKHSEKTTTQKVAAPTTGAITSKETAATIRRNHSYRMEEEHSKKSSSEYTRRGQLWSKHASWNLPKAPRSHRATFRYPVQGLEHVIVSNCALDFSLLHLHSSCKLNLLSKLFKAILSKFDVDPRRGFLPSQDPLQRLPYARYYLDDVSER